MGNTLKVLAREAKEGITTAELDVVADREIKRQGAIPSFKGYNGFPASACISINEEIVHGIPGKRKLIEGDIVSFDTGSIFKGYQGDAAMTVGIGKIDSKTEELVKATQEALMTGIAQARAGAHIGDISVAIQSYAESRGFSVVREYTGHGIGREMHEDPAVPNFGLPGQGPKLRKGMTIALEPMLIIGDRQTKVNKDGWTVVTADGSLSAHFEHTIVITDGGAEILTLPSE